LIVAEDALDRFVTRWVEQRVRNSAIRIAVRVLLTRAAPCRTQAPAGSPGIATIVRSPGVDGPRSSATRERERCVASLLQHVPIEAASQAHTFHYVPALGLGLILALALDQAVTWVDAIKPVDGLLTL
jgi:hypothetical protein